MKRLTSNNWDTIISIIAALLIVIAAFFYVPSTRAQEFKRVNNTFVTTTIKSVAEKTKYQWQDSTGKTYDVYISKKSGACYVLRTSQKTGKEYKYYLPEEITAQICKEMGIKRTKRVRK